MYWFLALSTSYAIIHKAEFTGSGKSKGRIRISIVMNDKSDEVL